MQIWAVCIGNYFGPAKNLGAASGGRIGEGRLSLARITPRSKWSRLANKMGKRKRLEEQKEIARKRLAPTHVPPTSEEVTSARQLQGLLAFTQDGKKRRHGTAPWHPYGRAY